MGEMQRRASLERVRCVYKILAFFLSPETQGRDISRATFPKESKTLHPQFTEDVATTKTEKQLADSVESCCFNSDTESCPLSLEGRKHEASTVSTSHKTSQCSWAVVHF